ncbi:hypothetical protein [Brasilonema octagenarum]|uniref:Uncharacterized protein n=1 Tax=Brasilonema octagenarum UFV-OR1 TaxID=417115 RepID=A0ABX1M8T0_9CYAN|nr:hypothetical protein [Brasilonema octagenarum]NMF64938.1 hypothetical protein [Brasilonema octagenarum UFV-OR1]
MEAVSNQKTQKLTQQGLVKFVQSTHRIHISWRACAYELSYWTDEGLEKENLLQEVMDFLLSYKYFITVDQGWSNWDLEIYRGIWSKIQVKVCTENHGGNKRVLRVRCAPRMSQFATMAIIGYFLYTIVAIVLGMPEIGLVIFLLGVFNSAIILYQNFRLGRTLYQVLEIVAKKLHLQPIHAKSTHSVVRTLQPQ